MRLSRSFIELTKIQARLRATSPLPDATGPGPGGPPRVTPASLQLPAPMNALAIIDNMRKLHMAHPATTGPRPLSAAAAALPQAPLPSTLVPVAGINPSLAPLPNVSPLGLGSSFGLLSSAPPRPVKAGARKAPSGGGGGGSGAMGGMGGMGGQKMKAPARRGIGVGGGGGSGAPPRPGGASASSGSLQQHGGGGGGMPPIPPGQMGSGAMVGKPPTVTLPANMLPGGGGGGGGGGAGGGARPGVSGGQMYMTQLMALIQKRPELKSRISAILGRQDLNDAQRIELIGEVLKAANVAGSAAAAGGGAGAQQQQQQQLAPGQPQLSRPPKPPPPAPLRQG